MMDRFVLPLAFAAMGIFTAVDVAIAQQPTTIAGRTIADYTAQLDDDDRVVRLRAVKSLGAFGEAAGEALISALDHDDKAVQYTAAVHLGRIGGKPLQDAQGQLEQVAKDKDSLAVRMAASFALCRGGATEQYLPILIEGLQYPERGMVCGAAELLGMLGPAAAAAVEPLQQAYEQNRPGVKGGDYHIGGAAMNALRKIQGQ
jgi:HEAT repeat protein